MKRSRSTAFKPHRYSCVSRRPQACVVVYNRIWSRLFIQMLIFYINTEIKPADTGVSLVNSSSEFYRDEAIGCLEQPFPDPPFSLVLPQWSKPVLLVCFDMATVTESWFCTLFLNFFLLHLGVWICTNTAANNMLQQNVRALQIFQYSIVCLMCFRVERSFNEGLF